MKKPRKTQDGYQNLIARIGLGAGSQADQAQYGLSGLSYDRATLDAMYRGSWIIGKAIDAPAEDILKAGIDLDSEMDPKDQRTLMREMRKRKVFTSLTDAYRWAALYGGAIAVPLIDGQDVETPLRRDTISKGQFKGLAVLDRWMVSPETNSPITEFGPNYGKPGYYNIIATSCPLSGKRVHWSRVLKFEGIPLPHYQSISNMYWGMSRVERIYDRLLAFDSATNGAAQLVFKAYLRTVKIEGLRQILAAGGEAEEALTKQMASIRAYQSLEGLTLLDAKDEFQATSYTFSGLDAVLLQFGQQLAGALEIPMVRLFGQSPAGLNSSGESDLRTYYDGIEAKQEEHMTEPVETVLDLCHRSVFGGGMDEDGGFSFNPLWSMSDTEKVDIADKVTTSVNNAYSAGLIDRATALKELRQSSDITGVWSNITDEMITEAENEEPPEPEYVLPPPDAGQEGDQPAVPPGEAGGAPLREPALEVGAAR